MSALSKGTQGVKISDQVVRDLDIPIMTSVLKIQDTIFAIADDIGIGDEVRAIVYSIRTFEYAGVVAANFLPAGAAAGVGAGVLTAIGGFATLGVVVVIGVLFSGIFGSDDDEVQKRRDKRAQNAVLLLLDHYSIKDFAKEQRAAAATARSIGVSWRPPDPIKGAKADQLALFYERCAATLSKGELAILTAILNLSRWTTARAQFRGLSKDKRDYLDNMIGTSGPRKIDRYLTVRIDGEVKKLEAFGHQINWAHGFNQRYAWSQKKIWNWVKAAGIGAAVWFLWL